MTNIHFLFNFQKAIEAAGLFLDLCGGRTHNIRLMKLLYMADRQCLGEEARTITGDRFFAMQKGPGLCTVHDLIRKKDIRSPLWQCCIKTDEHDVIVANSPGTNELYQFEKKIIKDVFQSTKDKNIVALTHTFPEWKKYEASINDPNKKNSYPITIQDILEGLGKPELLSTVEDKIADELYYSELFKT